MQSITLTPPNDTDGHSVFSLVEQCPPLDTNSLYCNLLQCSHFSNTSVIAKSNGKTVGFISGYLLPQQSSTLFIWQVAVDRSARGQGLALQMLHHIVEREACSNVSHIETTITENNSASWALFESFARHYRAPLVRSVMFDKNAHFAGAHDSELLAKIGPLSK